jgi:hypothetical protein
LLTIVDRSNKLIQVERDATMSLKGDNYHLGRKNELLVNEFDNLKAVIAEKDKEINKLKKKIQEMEEITVRCRL